MEWMMRNDEKISVFAPRSRPHCPPWLRPFTSGGCNRGSGSGARGSSGSGSGGSKRLRSRSRDVCFQFGVDTEATFALKWKVIDFRLWVDCYYRGGLWRFHDMVLTQCLWNENQTTSVCWKRVTGICTLAVELGSWALDPWWHGVSKYPRIWPLAIRKSESLACV